MNSLASTILAAVIGAAFTSPAQAVTKYHDLQSGPASRCQSAAATYDASLARKALALQNTGTASIFVTCAFEFEHIADALNPDLPLGFYKLSVWFMNHAAANLTVSCTAVTGHETGSNQYVPKSVLIAPGVEQNIDWNPEDFPLGFDDGGGVVAITCTLPPGAAVNDTHMVSTFDDATDPPPA